MKYQVLLSLNNNEKVFKNVVCCSRVVALRVKKCTKGHHSLKIRSICMWFFFSAHHLIASVLHFNTNFYREII